MRLKLTSKAMIACGIGACLFVTTAFADMLLGSGYDKLKKSAKHTTAQLAAHLDSYTMEGSLSVKIDGENLVYDYINDKYDLKNERQESISVNATFQNQYETYRYRDREQLVRKHSDDANLYVSQYSEDYYERYPYDTIGFPDPFHQDGAAEVEKIIDAVVGNLQNLVLVENADHGGYIYKGNLNASQVPALVNAVSSYFIKNNYNNERKYNKATYLPELSSDLYIQSVSGEVQENADGLITKVNGELLLSGKDVDGVSHTIEATLDLEIKDINATVVETPDLSNAIVETISPGYQNQMINENTAGTYINNIVMEHEGKIIKIGERTLDIDSISKDGIVGKLSEVVYEGYEDQYRANQYTFTGIEVLSGIVVIHYTDDKGNESTAVSYKQTLDSITFEPDVKVDIHDHGSYSYSSTSLENFNSTFLKVFE